MKFLRCSVCSERVFPRNSQCKVYCCGVKRMERAQAVGSRRHTRRSSADAQATRTQRSVTRFHLQLREFLRFRFRCVASLSAHSPQYVQQLTWANTGQVTSCQMKGVVVQSHDVWFQITPLELNPDVSSAPLSAQLSSIALLLLAWLLPN